MSKTKTTIGLFLFTLFGCFSTHSLAEPVSLSLQDLITIALKDNPQIEIAMHQYAQSQSSMTQANSVYLPHLSTTAGINRHHIENVEPVDEDNVALINFSASQLIYDFGKATGLINSTKYLSDASRFNFIQYLHDVIYSVKQNYYSVLEKERLIEVAEKAVFTYEQHLIRAQKYYEAGVRTRIDVTNAEVELSNARLDLLHATSDFKTARVKLEQILGSVPNMGDYTLITEDPELDMMSEQKPGLTNHLQNYLQSATENRPILAQMDALIKSSESTLKQVKGNYWPSIAANGEYNGYETDITSLADQWYFGIGLTWEFFSGFETDGQVAEAKSKIRELQASLRELELSITQDVTDSYLRADENRQAVDLASQTYQLAEENLELAEGRYKAGLNDMIEFNDAQLTYTRSQSNLVATYYSYLTALARMERAAGIVPEMTAEDINTILLNKLDGEQ